MPDETIWIVTADTSDESPQLVTADGGKTALGMGGAPFLDVDAPPKSSTPPQKLRKKQVNLEFTIFVRAPLWGIGGIESLFSRVETCKV
ncbi:hypothetical protein QUA70_12965 [Microcoleus sp. LAD1_D5]|uniref:hypothetical protein n=1 Tax=unclassified Microcoleus TaxID=2642155 RepID=UPI002FCF4859